MEDNPLIRCISKLDGSIGKRGVELVASLGSDTFKALVEASDFLEAIQKISSSFGEEVQDVIVNTVLYIMHLYEDEWVSVEALCLTVFLNFSSPLVNYYGHKELVMSSMSKSIYQVFCSSGLFTFREKVKREQRESGHYAVKVSELFKTLFVFQEKTSFGTPLLQTRS